jgi:hypothetical protein
LAFFWFGIIFIFARHVQFFFEFSFTYIEGNVAFSEAEGPSPGESRLDGSEPSLPTTKEQIMSPEPRPFPPSPAVAALFIRAARNNKNSSRNGEEAISLELLLQSGVSEAEVFDWLSRGLVQLEFSNAPTMRAKESTPNDVPKTIRVIPTPAGLNRLAEPIRLAGRVKTPRWDPNHLQLSWGFVVVKRFTKQPDEQKRLLDAFEEQGWSQSIDDPLPPKKGKNPRRRLKHTIKNLNRRQVNPVIHFSGRGDGKGICWRFIG